MRRFGIVVLLVWAVIPAAFSQEDAGWLPLFDGRTLEGWQAGEHPDTPKVEDGAIVCHGPRAHLFYVGPVENHDFKNFEFKADVYVFPRANSGIFFHTEFDNSPSPRKGYEVQINNTLDREKSKTGGLYNILDLMESPVPDLTWFTMYIKVAGKTVTVKLNDKTVLEYVEPERPARVKGREGRLLSRGTFALQAHDPGSRALFKNIYVRPIREGETAER